ncbi:nphp3 [Symbiodinium pilosum]|uniref:Nphp3 protein n=1 Tax=Symbiodinium pilosum TaxID=2952 RepID=A0A812KH51_SYMPI|nr:nphp3 [Symbiodinium pilosum]
MVESREYRLMSVWWVGLVWASHAWWIQLLQYLVTPSARTGKSFLISRISRLMEANRCVLVCGETGDGKSTLIRNLVGASSIKPDTSYHTMPPPVDKHLSTHDLIDMPGCGDPITQLSVRAAKILAVTTRQLSEKLVLVSQSQKQNTADRHLTESLQMKRALHGDLPHHSVAVTLHELGMLLKAKGDLEVAERHLTESLQMQRAVRGELAHQSAAVTLHELGMLFKEKDGMEADRDGGTALHLAAKLGHDKVVEALVSADPNQADRSYYTALHLATKRLAGQATDLISSLLNSFRQLRDCMRAGVGQVLLLKCGLVGLYRRQDFRPKHCLH